MSEEQFVKKVQFGYLIDGMKLSGGLLLGAGVISLIGTIGGIPLTGIEIFGIASLSLHGYRLGKLLRSYFTATQIVKDLNLTFVSSVKDLKDAITETKDDNNDDTPKIH